MLGKKLSTFALGMILLGATKVSAQDPQYTQFYANQPFLNPAFTGAAYGPRVSLNYRAQWVSIPGAFRQFAAGYDQPLEIGKSLHGVGLLVHTDVAGEGRLRKTDFIGNYSFAIQFGSRRNPQHIRFGLSGGFQQSNIDIFRLRFPDQIDPREGFILQTQEPVTNVNGRLTANVHTGVAYYNSKVWAGVSIHNLTQPQQEFIGSGTQDSRLPMRVTATAGIKIPAGPPNNPEKITVSPAVLFMKQRNFNQLNLGTYVGIDPIIFGVWYRTNYNNYNGDFITSDAIAGLIGFKQGIFSIGYSYDFTISSLTNSISGGSHEIAIIMEFERNKPRVFKHRKLPCPRF